MSALSRTGVVGLALFVAVIAAASCSQEKVVIPDVGTVTTTTPATGSSAAPAPGSGADPTAQVVARLAGVDTNALQLGAAFNSQFLTLQFYAVGLDAVEAQCATAQIIQRAGEEFGTRRVSQIMSGSGITPDVLTPCLTTDRLLELARSGGAPDLSRAPVDLLRSLFSELASAGYESAGLTPVESTCVSDKVVGVLPDDQLVQVGTAIDLAAGDVGTALAACVDADRLATLAG